MTTRVLVICAICLIGRGNSTCPETKYLVSGTRPIPDEYLTASSEYQPEKLDNDHSPARSRLDTKEVTVGKWLSGGWAAQTNDDKQWIQARFLERTYITGIVTQGRAFYPNINHHQRVTSYQIHFSEDCVKFVTLTKTNGSNETFPGNTDQDSHVTNMLLNPVRALCVRIQPVTWVRHVSLRFDVLGCPCGNHYGLQCEHICPTNCASVNNSTWCDDQGVCVDGCFGDFFGRQCNNPCSSNCAQGANGSRCDQHGLCVNGCENDHFGSKCSNPCPTNCAPVANGRRCDQQGLCVNGCESDHFGSKCSNLCPTNCAPGANGSRCDQQGVCVNGCAKDHFGRQCSNLCPINCAPEAGGRRCSDPGACTIGCIEGYAGDKCESSIKMSEESVSGYKSGLIASLIVAVVAMVTIAVMICLLRKKRLTSKDVVNRSLNDRSGPAELNEHNMETVTAYCTLDNRREEAEPYASINLGHA